jgi:hypothetical protein
MLKTPEKKDAGEYLAERESVSPGKHAGSKLSAGVIKPVSYKHENLAWSVG